MDAEMPGAWKCDTCGFVLQKNVLHTGDGAISADTSPLNEKCPNEGKLMRPLTWREVNEDLYNQVVKLMNERQARGDCVDGSNQIRKELHAVIKRYMDESDVTVYQMLGTLDAVKMDLWDMLERKWQRGNDQSA